MKILLKILLTLGLVLAFNAAAQMDNSFNYQGELLDNGSPANGVYDIQVVMLDGSAQQVGVTSQHDAVQVTNGLFNLNVGFGISMFDGYENYYFEVSVRKTSVGGAYTTLSPVQELQSVPLASNLVNGNATAGQVLKFNGFQWSPANHPESPWSKNVGEISYSGSMLLNGNANIINDVLISGTSRLDGVTLLRENTYQPSSSNGQLKFMANFWCGTATTTVTRYYNGTYSSGSVSVVAGASSGSCTLTFPFDINERYWNVSSDSGLARGANCTIGSSNKKLNCIRYKISDGTDAGGYLNLLAFHSIFYINRMC